MSTRPRLLYYQSQIDKDMSTIQGSVGFARGLQEYYSLSRYPNKIYFATDTCRLWLNGQEYGKDFTEDLGAIGSVLMQVSQQVNNLQAEVSGTSTLLGSGNINE